MYIISKRMEELGDEEYWRREDFEDSKFYEREGKLRWVWRKGAYLGRKMVFTGVVISSAPFILPPLVALSAIGLTFSLPAGFVLATYACTDKLMNILLPLPCSPLYGKSRMPGGDEENYMVYRGEVDKGYGQSDAGTLMKEFEEDTRKELELLDECDREISDNYREIPTQEDNEPDDDTLMRVTEIVEEDVGMEQNLDSNAIPTIMEGIREGKNEISLLKREGVEISKDSLCAFVIEAEVGGDNEDNVEQVTNELAFVSPREEKGNQRIFADIDEDKPRNETAVRLLERVKDGGRDDYREADSAPKGKFEENEKNGEIPIKDVYQQTDDKNLFVIPEDVNHDGIGETEDLDETVGGRSEKEIETEIMAEEPELVIERKVVVNVKTSGDHTVADIHQATSSDEKMGTLVFSKVNSLKMADETKSDDGNGPSDWLELQDSFNKSPEGEDLASCSGREVSIDSLKVRIESISISEHEEVRLDQEVTAASSKVMAEDIWEQIHAIRTIIGHKTTPHVSCAEELRALYEFTGVEPPVLATDLADVNEKLYFLKSIVGVK